MMIWLILLMMLMAPLFNSAGTVAISLSVLITVSFIVFSEIQLFYNAFLSFTMDNTAMILITLSLVISLVMVLNSKTSKNFSLLLLSIWVMNLSIISIFLMSSPLGFYLTFEMSLLPIIFMILGWGYQPERLPASYALALYTIAGSFPLLISLLASEESFNFMMAWNSLILETSPFMNVFTLTLMTSFLVKFPIYFFHLWLPKAHVEAPVVGSMILAALLLKLGGYGMWRSLALISTSLFSSGTQIIALMGGAIIAILCTRQMDMKILIAYSSIAHMSFVIAALLSQTPLSALAAMGLMVAHGVSSSAMFAGANFIYEIFHTRNMSLSCGVLNLMPILSLFWFLVSLGNMGAPPTINLVSEIWSLMAILPLSNSCWLPISLLSFFGAAYTLVLYASTQQGQISLSLKNNSTSVTPMMMTMMFHSVWLLEGFLLII